MSQSSAMQSHNDSSNTADSQVTAANAAQAEGTERNQRATPSNHATGTHSTGVADHGRWSTRRIAIYALFVALAMAASLIELPIFPRRHGSNTIRPASSALSPASPSAPTPLQSFPFSVSFPTCSPARGAR